MTGRNHFSRRRTHEGPYGFHEDPPPPLPTRHEPIPRRRLEEELAIRHDDIRRLHADNQLITDENVGLRREISAVKEELHMLSQAIPNLRAEKELEVRQLIQKGLKLEAELRGHERFKKEFLQLQSEAKKLSTSHQELVAKVQSMTNDLKKMENENQQLPMLKGEIDDLRQELVRARTAFDYEKKARVEQQEQKQVMEKNLLSMSQEAEKLRAELQNRPRTTGPGPYGAMKSSAELGYPSLSSDGYGGRRGPYDAGTWALTDSRAFPRY